MSNKIEKMVRHYVNKTLNEMVGVMDAVIEEKVNKLVQERIDLSSLINDRPIEQPTLVEKLEYEPQQSHPSSAIREDIMNRLGVDAQGAYADIFADTARSSNPILSDAVPTPGGAASGNASPEIVPEHILKKAGFLKDYSKHMAAFETKDQSNAGDAEADAAYKEALAKIHGG